jgi:hypothetical protein
VATHNVTGRVLASLGNGGPVDSQFEPCADVPNGGVLLALPALLASGLWEHSEEHFRLPPGYYQLAHGTEEELKLAERATTLSNGFTVREIWHLDEGGHQTSVLATPQRLSLGGVVERLCEELTVTETVFPTTKLRLVYTLAGESILGKEQGGVGEGSLKTPRPDD